MPVKKDIKKELRKEKKKLRYYESKHPDDVEGYKNISELVASLEKEDKRQKIVIAVKKEKARQRKELEDMTEDEFLDQEYKENNKKNIEKKKNEKLEKILETRRKFYGLIMRKIMLDSICRMKEDYVKKLAHNIVQHIE